MTVGNASISGLVFAALALILNSGLGIYVATRATAYLQHRFGTERVATGARIAYEAVAAVDQVAKSAGWDNSVKLHEAFVRARALGAAHNLDLSDLQWRTLLEAAVGQARQVGTVLTTDAPVVPAPSVGIDSAAVQDLVQQTVVELMKGHLAAAPVPVETPAAAPVEATTVAVGPSRGTTDSNPAPDLDPVPAARF